MRQRKDRTKRKAEILAAAIIEAKRVGYNRVQCSNIAERAECSPRTVRDYFTTLTILRRAIMGEAIRLRDLEIIAQGIVAKDPRAAGLPDDVRKAAIATLS